MIEGVLSQSGSSTISEDVGSVPSEGRPDGWNWVVRTSGLNLTFLRGVLCLDITEDFVPLGCSRLFSNK